MPMKTKNMTSIDLFCASPASTAICKATITKPLHRLNSYLGDHYKSFTTNLSSRATAAAPCISELPLTPRRKSSADVYDLRKHHRRYTNHTSNYPPPPRSSSSRYLLGDSPFLDSLSSHSEYITPTTTKESLALPPTTPVFRSEERELRRSRTVTGRVGSFMDVAHNLSHSKKSTMLANPTDQRRIKSKHSGISDSPALKSSSCAQSQQQVVALRVSLHCRACEAKLRKHLSKMEGVTSFSIDMETKKVVVIGKVTPSNVLTSISKVKNAQFWPSPSSGSLTSSSSSSTSSRAELSYYLKGQLSVN